VGNEKVSKGMKEINILHTKRGGGANCIGQILRRNYLLKHVNEGKTEGNNKSDGKTKKT
jgi:hypothetical protein